MSFETASILRATTRSVCGGFRSRKIGCTRRAGLSLRVCRKCPAAISGRHRDRSSRSNRIDAQGDHPSLTSSASTGCHAWWRPHGLRASRQSAASASSAHRMLLRHRQLRSRRDHLARPNINESDMSFCGSLEFWRRLDHRRFRSSHVARLIAPHIWRRWNDIRPQPRAICMIVRKIGIGCRGDDLCIGRNDAARGSRSVKRNDRGDRSGGHHIRQRNIMVQLKVRRDDNCLRTVVRLARNRKNRLFGKRRIACLRLRCRRRTRVEWRQIFLRRICDQGGAVKRGRPQDLLLPKPCHG